MSRRRKAVAAIAVAAAVAAAGGFLLTRSWQDRESSPAAAEPSPTTATPDPGAGAVPTGDLDAVDDEGEPAEPDDGQVLATDEPLVVTTEAVPVTVTFAGWDAAGGRVEVGGYVGGVVEDGGTCTLTLSQAGRSVTIEAEALPDATTTSCGVLAVPGDRLAAGTWQAVLAYSSGEHSGAAPAVDVEVAR